MFWDYLKIGFQHVIPLGYDHILFILSLFFFNSKLKTAIIQCSIFTLAHSLTLALLALGYLKFNTNIIESVIALSIFFVALENTTQPKLKWWRLGLVFAFREQDRMQILNPVATILILAALCFQVLQKILIMQLRFQ